MAACCIVIAGSNIIRTTNTLTHSLRTHKKSLTCAYGACPSTLRKSDSHSGVTKMPMMLPSTALTNAAASLPLALAVKTTLVDTVVGIAAMTTNPAIKCSFSGVEAASARARPAPMQGMMTKEISCTKKWTLRSATAPNSALVLSPMPLCVSVWRRVWMPLCCLCGSLCFCVVGLWPQLLCVLLHALSPLRSHHHHQLQAYRSRRRHAPPLLCKQKGHARPASQKSDHPRSSTPPDLSSRDQKDHDDRRDLDRVLRPDPAASPAQVRDGRREPDRAAEPDYEPLI